MFFESKPSWLGLLFPVCPNNMSIPSDSGWAPGFRSLCLPPLGDFAYICLMGTHFWGTLLLVVIVDFAFAFDFPAFLPLLSFLFLMVPYIFHKWVFWFSDCSFLKTSELYINFIYLTIRWGHWTPWTWFSSTTRLPVDLELQKQSEAPELGRSRYMTAALGKEWASSVTQWL